MVLILQRSVPASPSRLPSQSAKLSLPILSRIFSWPIVHKRRPSDTSVSSADEQVAPSSSPNASKPALSPQGSPSGSRIRTVKNQVLACSSGDELKTHAQLIDANPSCKKECVVVNVSFEVRNGVNTKTLLAYARGEVLRKAVSLGGDTILNERWTCNVFSVNSKGPAQYKVLITYEGTPARTEKRLPDPARPVCLDKIQGIPGLMTIVSRESRFEKLSSAPSSP